MLTCSTPPRPIDRTVASSKSKAGGNKPVVQNRRARHDYFIDDVIEAGMVLQGTEVKVLREGKGSLAEAWVKIDADGEAWLMQSHLPEYSHGGYTNHHPTRERKLLLNRSELDRLAHAIKAKGVSLVPIKIYFSHGRAKLQVGVGRGKKNYDKRESLKAKQAGREMARALKHRS